MFTFTKIDFESTLPLIGAAKPMIKINCEHGIIKVNSGSNRLKCFVKSQQCVSCYRKGSVFLVQSHKIKNANSCKWCAYHKHFSKCHLSSPHINMYHVESNGQLVMMTKDHIIPSSKGGADTQDNLQTMCNHCNSKKSDFSFDDFLKNGCKDMRKLHSIQQCV